MMENTGTHQVSMSLRHAELLDKIEAIFLAKGMITMTELAGLVRCSKRALYELAPNRRALFLLVVRRWTERIRQSGAAATAVDSDPRERLAAYLRPAVSETSAASETFLADLSSLPEAEAELAAHQRARIAGLRDIIDDGVAVGRFKPCSSMLVAELCLSGIERINDPLVRAATGLTFSEAFAQFYSLLIGGIASNDDL